MKSEELRALLVLQHIPFLGDGSIKKLIQVFGSGLDVLQQKKHDLLRVDGIGAYKLQSFYDPAHQKLADQELEFIHKNNIQVTTYQDEGYPQRLKHCIDSPIVLFTRGNIELNQKRILSIVGTRKVTRAGATFIANFLEELALLDPIIVSGFAYGVDILSHKAAIDHKLQTIGVLGHGLNQIYPKVHSKYVKVVEEDGGFMTDFWSSDPFVHTNFLRRNRIIAGISEATIVIESAAKGGSLVTAELANGYSRDVFAVPGRVDDKQSEGCNNLIKQQKAHLLTSVADIMYILNWSLEEKQTPVVQKKLFVELDEDERKVFHYLKESNKQLLDIIALNCEFPTYKTASLLLNMELKGVVRPLPGKLFELV